ncbi:hypothetical protein IAR50_004759 [Cryptococcus sp. DSM 104548]
MLPSISIPLLAAGTYLLGSAATNALVIKRDTFASPGALGFIYPPPREYNSTYAGTRPCGEAAVSSTREYVPLNGGNIWLLSQTKVENIQLNYANSEDPTEQTDFDSMGMAMTGLTGGDMCVPLPDFTTYGLTFGAKLTLQVAYATEANSGSKLYQCADIELISAHDYEAPSYTCTNTSTIWSDSDATSTSAASTVTVTSSSSGKVSPLAAGWIGAVVTLVVVSIALGIAHYVGLVLFRRSTSRAKARQSGPIKMRNHMDQSEDDISLHRRTTVDHKGPF